MTVARYPTDKPGTRETRRALTHKYEPPSPKEGEATQTARRESDKPILARKPGNAGGAKGLTSMRPVDVPTPTGTRDLRDRTAGHGTGVQFSTKLKSLTLRAGRSPKYRFISLMHLITEDFLLACFGDLKRNKAPGIDEVTMTEYEANLEENIKSLLKRLKARHYRPQPVKRVYIPKANGQKRPLGIPTVEDKVVQMACKKILEVIFEADFLPTSYGFRPGRGCHDALDDLSLMIMKRPINFVVDMDIERFFDTVNHEWLMKCLKQRIQDTVFLRLITRFLKAGVVSEGRHLATVAGTPQGSVLSPVLANIYLHYILDLWFERVVKPRLNGYAQLIRYADDFIIGFQSEREAKRFAEVLRTRLAKFGLRLAAAKSRIIEFGRYRWQTAGQTGKRLATFDFLGITHYCDRTRTGNFKLGRQTARTRLRRALQAMNEWLKLIRNQTKYQQWWPILAAKLRGHYNYYGIGGNGRSIKNYYDRVRQMVWKWLNRRSQQRSYNWDEYQRLLRYNPLPKPRICHGYPSLTRMYA
jgi:RNA-directed DNA polymerase